MRSLIIWVITLGMLAFACDSAFARLVSISGTHSKAEIKETCNKVGGTYSEDSGGYGCANDCNGGLCVVGCKNNGKCNGNVPFHGRPPHTLGAILHLPSGLKTTGGAGRPKHGWPVTVGGVKPPYLGHGRVRTGGLKTKAIYGHPGGPTDSGGKGFTGYRGAKRLYKPGASTAGGHHH